MEPSSIQPTFSIRFGHADHRRQTRRWRQSIGQDRRPPPPSEPCRVLNARGSDSSKRDRPFLPAFGLYRTSARGTPGCGRFQLAWPSDHRSDDERRPSRQAECNPPVAGPWLRLSSGLAWRKTSIAPMDSPFDAHPEPRRSRVHLRRSKPSKRRLMPSGEGAIGIARNARGCSEARGREAFIGRDQRDSREGLSSIGEEISQRRRETATVTGYLSR